MKINVTFDTADVLEVAALRDLLDRLAPANDKVTVADGPVAPAISLVGKEAVPTVPVTPPAPAVVSFDALQKQLQVAFADAFAVDQAACESYATLARSSFGLDSTNWTEAQLNEAIGKLQTIATFTVPS